MQLTTFQKRLLYLLFALSGFCALLYEILWTKHLSLAFGTTILAVSVVTATFMGGLALGTYLLGRYCDRECNLLAIYALLEAGIAFFALTFAPALAIASDIHIYLERLLPYHPFFTHGLHFIFASLLLLPPAVCMGGTFPLMCRLFARKKSGGQIGRLYALNTLGATIGAFWAGYILLPELGLSVTTWIAVAINLGIAAASTWLSRSLGAVARETRTTRIARPLESRKAYATLLAIGLIGALSLSYEILWTRVLLLFLGSTTFAFSLILSAFLVCIALGGALYARLAKPELNEKRVFTLLSTGMGFSILCTAPFYDRLAYLFQGAHQLAGEEWWLLAFFSFVIVFAVMALPTILSGALLPAAVAILNPGTERTGEGVGLVVLYNTIGAMLGSIVAGFILIPWLGVENAFRLLATLNILLGAGYFLRHHVETRLSLTYLLLPLIGLSLAAAPFDWSQKLLNSGVYCYAPMFANYGGIDQLLQQERIIEVIEGVETTVAIKETDIPEKTRYFSVNGKTDGGTGRDIQTQIMVGQLPLLLHSRPEKALVIGLGTGITLGGVIEHALKQIDCAEISPEVVRASGYFINENRNALADPRVTLHIEDGRNLLLVGREKYDVIISQPSNPWQTGNANLFTAEYYRLAAAQLEEDGIFSQWIGLYDITPDNLRIACNTFLNVFPYTLTFKVGADLIMVGASHPLAFDYRNLAKRISTPQVSDMLTAIGIKKPGDLIARHYFLSDASLRAFAGKSPINTDVRPILEYSFRYNLGDKMFGRLKTENLAAMSLVAENQIVPLANLGNSKAETVTALRELETSYSAAGKNRESRFFMEKIKEYTELLADDSVPARPARGG